MYYDGGPAASGAPAEGTRGALARTARATAQLRQVTVLEVTAASCAADCGPQSAGREAETLRHSVRQSVRQTLCRTAATLSHSGRRADSTTALQPLVAS